MSTNKVFLGVLAGVAAGAILGILFAPDKGSETRKKLTKMSGEFADTLKEKFNEYLDNMSDKLEDLKGEVSDIAGKGKNNIEKTKKEVETA